MPTTASVPTLSRSEPLSLRIPSIGVATHVVDEGLTADGALQVPPLTSTGTHEAGWYDLGPAPGQTGPAVIVGHVDSTSGPAVFYRLGSLAVGNKIMVGRANGTTATFTVTAVRQYPKASFPTQAVYGPIPYAGLRLITCGGKFDPASGHYLSNIVAYATAA
ncbi:MAG: class F sortase [Acidimicrobiales bacterium]